MSAPASTGQKICYRCSKKLPELIEPGNPFNGFCGICDSCKLSRRAVDSMLWLEFGFPIKTDIAERFHHGNQ